MVARSEIYELTDQMITERFELYKPEYLEMLEEKAKNLEQLLTDKIETTLKTEVEKLKTVVEKLDEKLELIKIQYIKTKRNESDLKRD